MTDERRYRDDEIAAEFEAGLTYDALRPPRWARRREQQMDSIVARAKTLIAEPERDALQK